MKAALLISISTIYHDGRIKTYIQKLLSLGFKVFVISLKETDDEKFVEKESFTNYKIAKRYIGNSKIGYVSFYFLFFSISFFLIPYLTLKHKISIIHYNNSPNFIVFASLISKLFGKKIILDNHDIVPLMVQSKFKNKFLISLAEAEQSLSMNFADKILCADHNQQEYLIEHNIDAKKITVVLNVPNKLLMNYTFEKINKDNFFNLVYHGTISYRLGLDFVIEAIKIIKAKVPLLRFHLVGKGDYLTKTTELVKQYDLQKYILIYNKYIAYEELPKLLYEMDAGVIGNRNEPLSDYMLPVKLLEYVSLNIPVIVPQNKIISRYFSKDMVCYYEPENVSDLASKILLLYNDSNLRNNLTLNASSFTKKYNYTTEMEKYSGVINSLLN